MLSKYAQEYYKKPAKAALKPVAKLYMPNTQPMELNTVYGSSFVSKSLPAKAPKERPPTAVQTKIADRSLYRNDFPDWGATKVVYEKHWHPPVRSTEIAFHGSSSYKDSFKGVNKSALEFSKDTYGGFCAHLSNLTLGSTGHLDSKTTYQTTMQDFSRKGVNYRVAVTSSKPRRMSVSPKQYRTTAQEFYKNPASPVKDPRLARIALMSRG